MIDICKEMHDAYDRFIKAVSGSPEEAQALREVTAWVNLYSETSGISHHIIALGLMLDATITVLTMEDKSE